MKRLSLPFKLSLFGILGGLLLFIFPNKTFASTLFLDQFNGSNETLSQYNSDYVDYCLRFADGPNCGYEEVNNGEVISEQYDNGYLYTGLTQTNGCVAMNFDWVGIPSGEDSIIIRGNPNNYDEDEFQARGDGTWNFYEDAGLQYFDSGPLTLTPGPHQIEICANGTSITGYVDNVLYAAESDNTNTSGYAGFGIQSPTNAGYTGGESTGSNFQINSNTSPAVPMTFASLSPTPFSDGTYPDPTTITLTATPPPGYTITNTYYMVDGGSQQTYSLPFTVTGSGNHTITYWSVDSNGDTEPSIFQPFTISETVQTPTPTPAPPSVGTITATPSPVKINSSMTSTTTFTDPDTNVTDNASWNWGDGNTTTGTVTESNGSGSVTNNHTYTSLGSDTITLTVSDSDDSLTGTSQTILAVIPTGGLKGANLNHSNYSGANLSGQNISGSNLSDATFNNVNFDGADLAGSNGSDGSFTSSNFTSADLAGANLNTANMSSSNFTDANLKGANLSNANLTDDNFTGADLKGANISAAALTGATWSNTTCPNNTNSNNDNNTCVGE